MPGGRPPCRAIARRRSCRCGSWLAGVPSRTGCTRTSRGAKVPGATKSAAGPTMLFAGQLGDDDRPTRADRPCGRRRRCRSGPRRRRKPQRSRPGTGVWRPIDPAALRDRRAFAADPRREAAERVAAPADPLAELGFDPCNRVAIVRAEARALERPSAQSREQRGGNAQRTRRADRARFNGVDSAFRVLPEYNQWNAIWT